MNNLEDQVKEIAEKFLFSGLEIMRKHETGWTDLGYIIQK